MDSATEAAWSSVYPEDKARSVPVVALNLFFIPSSFCLSSLQVELIETLGKISPALKMAAIDLRLDRRCLCATCLKFQRWLLLYACASMHFGRHLHEQRLRFFRRWLPIRRWEWWWRWNLCRALGNVLFFKLPLRGFIVFSQAEAVDDPNRWSAGLEEPERGDYNNVPRKLRGLTQMYRMLVACCSTPMLFWWLQCLEPTQGSITYASKRCWMWLAIRIICHGIVRGSRAGATDVSGVFKKDSHCDSFMHQLPRHLNYKMRLLDATSTHQCRNLGNAWSCEVCMWSPGVKTYKYLDLQVVPFFDL